MPDNRPMSWLASTVDMANVATELDDGFLGLIGTEVVRNYDLDLASRADWEEITERAMKLAKQVFEQKTFPTGEPSSSVKFPLLTEASIQFASRAFPELIKGNELVKCQITGDDPDNTKQDRADRIKNHMDYQLLKVMKEWLEDMDQALHTHPIVGGFVKKTYYDNARGRNVSELISLLDYVVNQSADRHRLRRETHRYWYYKNDILEKMRSGLWLEHELGQGNRPEDQGEQDVGHEIIEQHCFYDLDGDDYKEPWIITVHRQTSKVLRIRARFEAKDIKFNKKNEIARIEPTSYFTVYKFFPDPQGGFYPLGLGHLLEPLSEAINTILNQLIDAGTLANRAGGFIAKGVKLKGGRHEVSPFKWQFVDATGVNLRDAIFPVPVREPSPVLFQLLGLLIEAARGVANLKEVLSGETKSLGKDLSPTTYMGLVEQGLKVFIGIYKRFYDSLTDELQKLYRLNAIYGEPTESFRVSGKPQTVALSDYQDDDLEVLPVADPNMATDLLKRGQDQALMMIIDRPGINPIEVIRRAVRNMHTGDEEKLLLTDEQLTGQEPMPFQRPPDPRVIIAQAKDKEQQAKTMEAGMRFQMDAAKFQMELIELEERINNLRADTLLKLANAEAAEAGPQLAQYQAQASAMATEVKLRLEMAKQLAAQAEQQGGKKNGGPGKPAGVSSVASAPGNAAAAPGA